VRAVILSIGDELVLGQSVDTNAAWLSGQLAALGILVKEHVTIGDDQTAIADQLRRAATSVEIIISTGGLGPTDDDLTRYALADVLETDLRLDEDSLRHIEGFFVRRDRAMPDCNRIQAMFPAGTEIIPNPVGTAPGILAQIDSKDDQGRAWAFFLPGVPREMKTMYTDTVAKRIRERTDQKGHREVILTRKIHTIGAGESTIAEILGDMMARGTNPIVNSTASNMVVSLRINARAADERSARDLIQPVEEEIVERLGDYVFGYDDDTLAGVVGQLLRERGETLAVAESCTGGWLGKMLTDISGSSDYFKGGWEVYSNEAKNKWLQVAKEDIDTYGAVSEPVAHQLAVRAREIAEADYGIGITGIAGPGGGTEEKPVGLVYTALADARDVEVKKYIFPGDRDMVRRRTVNLALNLLRLKIQHLYL
jgi:competence/damage-inducible protein CinA-like protein